MYSSNLGFKNLPSNWKESEADFTLYSAQKCLTFDPVQSRKPFRHVVSNNGVMDLWDNVYLPRLKFLGGKSTGAPVIFPGRSPVLKHLLRYENASYERYKCLSSHRLLRSSEALFIPADSSRGARSWKWKSLRRDEMHQVTQIVHEEVLDPLTFVVPTLVNQETVKQKFHEIRSAWGSTQASNFYNEQALVLSANHLSKFPSPEVWFELEEFASYCTLRQSLNLVASGFHYENWIDIAEAPINNLRGTERCWPIRLMQELENLAAGRTAPLIVNEEGCVSDGNHRLVSAWIWKMLHSCIDCQWQTGDIQFETALKDFLERNNTQKTTFALMSALESLSSILNNAESNQTLRNLRRAIAGGKLTTLPVVPMLAYCNFALDGNIFDADGTLQRFSPSLYSELSTNAVTFFPARACYHLGDTVPLPWFSVTKSESLRTPAPTSVSFQFQSAKK